MKTMLHLSQHRNKEAANSNAKSRRVSRTYFSCKYPPSLTSLYVTCVNIREMRTFEAQQPLLFFKFIFVGGMLVDDALRELQKFTR